MSTAYNLSEVDLDGLLNEDVMQTIFNIDPVDLPFMDMAGRETSKNPYKSWVKEGLAAVTLDNALVDGADAPAVGTFDEARVGNHHQISGKQVSVSTRARNVDTIGYEDRLIHELMIRQKELRKQMEAILLSNQASVESSSTGPAAGKLAGAGATFETNIINGTAGGFAAGIYSAPTPGAARALTEDDLRDAGEAAYSDGGNPRILMSTPQMIRTISEYMFSGNARVATLQTNVATAKEGRYGNQGVTAIGSVNTFVSDFDTFTLTPNRTQLAYDNGGTSCVNVYLFDPDYWAVSYIYDIMTEELAKSGLADRRLMSVDYTLVAKQEKSSAVVMGINPALAMTAS
jgi:hypothetical protein